jgi:transposase InsO family protein
LAHTFHETVGTTKTALALTLGVARSSLYKRRKKPPKDWRLKSLIEETWQAHPAYGHRRLAIHLGVNKKRILRVLHLYDLAPPWRRRKKNTRKRRQKALAQEFPNILAVYTPEAPGQAWVSDFTKLYWRGIQLNLATILDAFTREILGWHILTRHTVDLVFSALKDALRRRHPPTILHSDEGSEYTAREYVRFVQTLGTRPSMSAPGSPWENGYMESFYDKLKVDLGDPDRFDSIGEFIAVVARHMAYYNAERIHTALKMPPALFAKHYAILTPSKVENTC